MNNKYTRVIILWVIDVIINAYNMQSKYDIKINDLTWYR